MSYLAAEAELPVAELLRLLVDASLKLGLPGIRRYINEANKAEVERLQPRFKKAKRRQDDLGESNTLLRGRLTDIKDEVDEDDPESEELDSIRKKERGRQADAPR